MASRAVRSSVTGLHPVRTPTPTSPSRSPPARTSEIRSRNHAAPTIAPNSGTVAPNTATSEAFSRSSAMAMRVNGSAAFSAPMTSILPA